MEKNLIEEYFNLFNYNQESVYWGSYDTQFEPFETPEGKLKYKYKVDKITQTRSVKSSFKIENVLTHLIYNYSNANHINGDTLSSIFLGHFQDRDA